MYIKIGNVKYSKLKNLKFTPQTDITGDVIPINEFSAEIKTDAEIKIGQFVSLYDDLDQLWAKFWIVFADRLNIEFVRINAQSIVTLLDRITLPAVIYTSATAVSTALDTIFNALSVYTSYTLDSAASSMTVTGYCPEQTGRERLQWICFACGLYVEQSYTDGIYIKVLDEETITDIPPDKTYWKPSVSYKDYVTAITVTAYSFAAGTPQSGDDYVTVNGVDYIITKTDVTLSNPDTSAQAAPPNVIRVDEVMLINSNNASDVISRLSMLYFERTEVDADVINNREYRPAQKVGLQLDDERGAVGYIESTDFSFGLQAKSRVHLVACALRSLSSLLIRYIYENIAIATRRYYLPEGYEYQIENPYIDTSSGTHRYIYRPVNEYASGTIEEGQNVDDQDVELALHYYGEQRLLYIISVSEIEFDSEEGVVTIG
jgi:hypothetical protein